MRQTSICEEESKAIACRQVVTSAGGSEVRCRARNAPSVRADLVDRIELYGEHELDQPAKDGHPVRSSTRCAMGNSVNGTTAVVGTVTAAAHRRT